MIKNIIQIHSHYFVAGLILEDSHCTEAAPIIKYMIGWRLDAIWKRCEEKGWKIVNVPKN